MSNAGRKKRPTSLVVLEGNRGRRPLNLGEPIPQSTEQGAKPPKWLDRQARREWRRIVPIMKSCGVFTDADVALMATYCQAYSYMQQAADAMKNEGGLIYRPNPEKIYYQQSAHYSIFKAAAKQMKEIAPHLGLTPSSRASLKSNKILPDAGSGGGMQKFLK